MLQERRGRGRGCGEKKKKEWEKKEEINSQAKNRNVIDNRATAHRES